MKICIIGGGWYGCHLARKLSDAGHTVTVVEKNKDIFNGISGNFGIRLHAGPHYPRSPKTRESCQRAFHKFIKEYPSLVVPHKYSMYALGNLDSFALPSKVNLEQFKTVCAETQVIAETENPKDWGYQDLQYIANINEPSIAVGARLREGFKPYLENHKIAFIFNTVVSNLKLNDNKVTVFSNEKVIGVFDRVINTTSYQSTELPVKNIKLPFQAKYQTCIGLLYQEKLPSHSLPFSFIVMDGLFPCIMPYAEEHQAKNVPYQKYLMTHGQWTNLGTFDEPLPAKLLLDSLTAAEIQLIRTKCEESINTFWPEFKNRFHYVSWKGTVLVKLLTDVEFRSAVTYADSQNIIHVIPGKVTNIFDVEEEVLTLINSDEQEIIKKEGCCYVKNGVLDDAMSEIIAKPEVGDTRNTGLLQTYLNFPPPFIENFNDAMSRQSAIVGVGKLKFQRSPATEDELAFNIRY